MQISQGPLRFTPPKFTSLENFLLYRVFLYASIMFDMFELPLIFGSTPYSYVFYKLFFDP